MSESDGSEKSTGVMSVSNQDYGDDYADHLLEQYKLYAESAMRVTAWRTSANNFFLTLNTALISLYGISAAFHGAALWQRCVCGGGITLAIVWWGMVESYRTLNSAKFAVIHELEKQLPVAVFTREWAIWKEKSKISALTRVERLVPCGFCFVFIVLLGISFFQGTETQPIQIQLDTTFESPLEIKNK